VNQRLSASSFFHHQPVILFLVLPGRMSCDPYFVHIAPDPTVTFLQGTQQRVAAGVKVLCGVSVLRVVAAAHLPADQTLAQMHPAVTHGHALGTDSLVAGKFTDLVEMAALVADSGTHHDSSAWKIRRGSFGRFGILPIRHEE
jgi:hypothetical protein